MKMVAAMLTWIGAALIGLASLLYTWHGESTLFDLSVREGSGADTVINDLTTVPAAYASVGWLIVAGVIAATGLFAMFSSPRDKWVAFIGQLLVAGAIGYGAWVTWSDASTNAPMLIVWGTVALAVVFAVLSIMQRVWLGALLTILAALAGLVLSVWLLITGTPDGVESFSFAGWQQPVGFLVVMVGALVSVAAAGKDRTEALSNQRGR